MECAWGTDKSPESPVGSTHRPSVIWCQTHTDSHTDTSTHTDSTAFGSPSDAEATRNALKALAADIAALRTEILRGADASVRVEESLKRGLPVRIKTFIGKIVGTVGGN